ncbi:MAG: flagellar basal body P-ring protein FlgI [Pirellulaceae bacterium]
MTPRLLTTAWIVGLQLLWLSGCNYPLMRSSQNPETENLAFLAQEEPDDGIELIGESTVALGMKPLKIEGIALVNGLDNTGSDPGPSSFRNALIGEMQSYEVKSPEKVLESPSNSLVIVRGYLRAGVEKGDSFDVEVIVPPKSKTTSLRGGHLMRCRLREMRVVDNAIHSGSVAGLAQGAVVVDSLFGGGDDEVMELRGRVLGGGQSQMSRPLGLAIRGESTVRQSAAIGAAINARFHKSDRSGQRGVATPKRDNYIELAVHPRYKHNITRYVLVINSIALHETPGQRVVRTESLQRRLLEPTTSARAALQLEAIGDDAVHVLLKGLESQDPEVRFYSAEALAYLDREEAATVLSWAANNVSAFRWHALTALAAMDHVMAYESLNELLHVASAETRYGAFRALRTRNAADPLVRGESLGGGFAYHVINSNSPAMIHLSKVLRSEIVMFGQHQPLVPPAFLFAGKNIMVKGLDDGRLRVTRFADGDREDQQETCDANVDSLIRSIVRLGGGYPEVVQALQEARQGGYLEAKVVVNAMARPGRTFYRDIERTDEGQEESKIKAASPIPEMFYDRLAVEDPDDEEQSGYQPDEIEAEPTDEDDAQNSFMGRMSDWFTK